MPLHSNPTARAIQILDYLAAHPLESYGLSELARQLGMNKTTCLAIVTTLVEAGYVLLHPSKRHYSIGPAIVASGQAALTRFPDISGALAVIQQLADEIRMSVIAEAMAGDQVIVVGRAGAGDPTHGIARVGMRAPLIPPYGAALVAWADIDTQRSYFSRVYSPLSPRHQRALEESFLIGRQRGYFATKDIPVEHPLHSAVGTLQQSPWFPDPRSYQRIGSARVSDVGYFIDNLKPDVVYQVANIAAPVHPRGAPPELALHILCYGWKATGREIEYVGRRTVEAAARISGLRTDFGPRTGTGPL